MNIPVKRIAACAATAGALLSAIAGLNTAAAAPVVYLVSGTQTYLGPATIVLEDAILQNQGTVNIADAGRILFRSTSSLENYNAFNISDSGVADFENGATALNAGSYTQTSGSTSITGGSVFTNHGSFEQSGGAVLVDAASTFNGTSSVVIGGGTMTVNGQLVQTGVIVNGGTLQGTGTIQSNVNNAGGTVGPGNSPGTLTVDGDFTQGPGGTLAIEIDSLSSFDILDVLGTADLDGTLALSVDGAYAASAQIGDSFTVMNWQSFTGTFASVTGLDLGDGKFFALDYDASGLTLTVATETAAVPEPGTIAILGVAIAGLACMRRRS